MVLLFFNNSVNSVSSVVLVILKCCNMTVEFFFRSVVFLSFHDGVSKLVFLQCVSAVVVFTTVTVLLSWWCQWIFGKNVRFVFFSAVIVSP